MHGCHEVLALHRFLFDYKGENLSSVYAGSPYIAAVQNRLADALEASDPGSGWAMWRAAEGHERRVEAVRRHLSSAGSWWDRMGAEQRRAYVLDILAPLRPQDGLLTELVEVHNERPKGPTVRI